MYGLGRTFDLSAGVVVFDSNSGAGTGKRVSLKNASQVEVLILKGAGSGTDDPVLTLKEHTASSGGSSQNLATGVTEYFKKSAASLAGTETWTRVTQSISATVTLTGEAQRQGIYVVNINATQLSDGYGYVSVDVADTGAAGAQLLGIYYHLGDLDVQRKPANLAASLS